MIGRFKKRFSLEVEYYGVPGRWWPVGRYTSWTWATYRGAELFKDPETSGVRLLKDGEAEPVVVHHRSESGTETRNG